LTAACSVFAVLSNLHSTNVCIIIIIIIIITLLVDILKQVIGELAPYFQELCNRSLTVGHLPETFKSVFITPLLKNPGLDATDVRSYRQFETCLWF
jgi:hypothetical protein